MADSQETRILKDINKHLAHMDEDEKGMTDRLSPSETASLNKNVQDIMGNFSSLINSQLKTSIKATSDAISSAFGQIDNDGEVAALGDIVDELKVSNQFADQADHNKFLEEQERETDLNINRRTNELLEDLNEKEDDSAKQDKMERLGSDGGMMKGLFGGLLAGGGIKKLLGGVGKLGKKLFIPALVLGAAAEFLRGWGEAGEDSATIDKFNSGIARLLSDLTFGLISKEFFENALIAIEGAITKAWDSFTKDWDAFVSGKMSAPDFFANLLSTLSFGAVNPEVIKDIGRSIEEGFYDLISPMVDAVVLAFEDLIQMLFGDLIDKLKKLVSDPLGFFRKSQKEKKLDDIQKRAQKLQDDEGLTKGAALRRAAKERKEKDDDGGWLENLFKKPDPDDIWKDGKWVKPTEKLEMVKPQTAAPDIKAKKKEPSNVGQEAVKKMVDDERRRRETKADNGGGGNAMQINANTTMAAPVDTQTENNDVLNLNRSSGISGN